MDPDFATCIVQSGPSVNVRSSAGARCFGAVARPDSQIVEMRDDCVRMSGGEWMQFVPDAPMSTVEGSIGEVGNGGKDLPRFASAVAQLIRIRSAPITYIGRILLL